MKIPNYFDPLFTSFVFTFLLFLGCGVESENTIDRKLYSIEVVDSFLINDPFKRFTFQAPFFYSYNFYSKQLHKHDMNFVVLDSLGGEGDAPHENRVVLNYKVLTQERVGIFDSDKNTYKIQDWNDSVHFYFKMNKTFDRGVVLNDSSVLMSYTYDKDVKLGFAISDVKNDLYSELEDVTKELYEPVSSFIYEGKLVKDGNDVYSFSYLYSNFFKIGLLDSSVTRLDYGYDFDIDKPKVFEISGGYLADDNPTYVVDAIVGHDYIYVLSNYPIRGFSDNRVLDVYDKRGFKYLRSHVIPNKRGYPANELFTDGKFIYFKYESAILKVALEQEKI